MRADSEISDLVFAPWDPAQADAIWAELGPTGSVMLDTGRSYCGPDAEGEHFRRARVIRDRTGALLGVMAARTNRHHPYRLPTYVEIVGHRRREGLGTAALAHLRDLIAADPRGHHAKCDRDSPGHAFITARGYSEIQGCRNIRVDLAQLGTPDPDFEVTLYEVGPGQEDVPEDCVRAWRDMYAATHTWNPTYENTLEDCRQAQFRQPAQYLTARQLTSGTVVGAAFLDDEPEHTLFTGCSVDPDDPRGEAIVETMLATAADLADERGLVGEVDTANHSTVAVLERVMLRVEYEGLIAATH